MNDLGPEARSILERPEVPRRPPARIGNASSTLCSCAWPPWGRYPPLRAGRSPCLGCQGDGGCADGGGAGGGSVTLLVRRSARHNRRWRRRAWRPDCACVAIRPVAVPKHRRSWKNRVPNRSCPRCGVVKWRGPRCDRGARERASDRVTPAPVPALNSLDPELTVLRQAQETCVQDYLPRPCAGCRNTDRRFGKEHWSRNAKPSRPSPCARFTRLRGPGPGEDFLRAAPESPLAERVRSACKRSDEISRKSNGIAPGRER